MLRKKIFQLGISPTLKINKYAKYLEDKGLSIYRFGFGQSPFPVPKFLQESLKKNVSKKEYGPVKGLCCLRESIANHYNRDYNLGLKKSNIIIGPGTKELLFLLQLVTKKDTFIISPGWVSYANQSKIINNKYNYVSSKTYNMKANDMMIVNYPNNPTGEIIDYNSLNKNSGLLVSDEIYNYLNYNNDKPRTMLEFNNNCIVSNGLSKWCGAGGWRLGYMIIPDVYKNILNNMAAIGSELYSCSNIPVQYAATDLFNEFDKMDLYLERTNKSLNLLNNVIDNIFKKSKIIYNKPEGGFYYFLDFSNYIEELNCEIIDDVSFCNMILEKTGVMLLAGSNFGMSPYEMTARLAFVDFDGEDIINNNLTDKEILEVCKKTIDGCYKLVNFLENDLFKLNNNDKYYYVY